jgi:hypothetical protein
MGTLKTLAAPFDPLKALPEAVAARAWVAPLLVTMGLTALGSATLASRVDPSSAVYAKLEASGELSKLTDRELSEQLDLARRIGIVGGVAKGLFGVPLVALASAFGAWLFGRLVTLRLRFVEAVTVVSLALLPMAYGSGATLAAALRQTTLSPRTAKALVPSALVVAPPDGPPAPSRWKAGTRAQLASLVDFFHLWSALVFGFGLASATGRSRWLLVPAGAALCLVVLGAALVGVPGLLEPAGGPRR